MNDGWLKLFYRLLEWEWYSDTNVVRLFIHLLLKANIRPLKWRGREIPRGSFVTSRAKLAEQTNLTDREVRTCLNKLKTTNEIAIETTNQFSIITICNFEKYQENKMPCVQQNDQPNCQRATNERPTSDQQTTKSKEEKNIRVEEEKNIIYNNISTIEIEGDTPLLPADASAPTATKPKKAEKPIPFKDIKTDWNTTCTAYPKLQVISEARKNKIRNRISEMGGVEKALPLLHELFEKMMASSFLRGDNRRGWKASFDWLFENDKNWVKVYEGNYDPKPTLSITPQQYDTTQNNHQYTNPGAIRRQEFERYIVDKLSTPDAPEPDISGNY